MIEVDKDGNGEMEFEEFCRLMCKNMDSADDEATLKELIQVEMRAMKPDEQQRSHSVPPNPSKVIYPECQENVTQKAEAECLLQLRVAEVGLLQLRLAEVGPLQLRPGEVGLLQLRLLQHAVLVAVDRQVSLLVVELVDGARALVQLSLIHI